MTLIRCKYRSNISASQRRRRKALALEALGCLFAIVQEAFRCPLRLQLETSRCPLRGRKQVSRRCPGGVQEASRRCPGGFQEGSRRLPGGVQEASGCPLSLHQLSTRLSAQPSSPAKARHSAVHLVYSRCTQGLQPVQSSRPALQLSPASRCPLSLQ